MNTSYTEKVRENYITLFSLSNGSTNKDDVNKSYDIIKYIHSHLRDSYAGSIANTILEQAAKSGYIPSCSDKQLWAIAYSTADRGILLSKLGTWKKKEHTDNEGQRIEKADSSVSITPNDSVHIAPISVNNESVQKISSSAERSDEGPRNQVSDGIQLLDSVEFEMVNKGIRRTLLIVRKGEGGDLSRGRMSIDAPVAQAFLGHHEEDIVRVYGNTFKIISVKKRCVA